MGTAPHVSPPIDWSLIGRSVEHFSALGFTMTEVPWWVSPSVTAITCPTRDSAFSTTLGDLVGSAEQGFLAMEDNSALAPGRWMAVTPCFRNEAVDATHQKGFMKLELYVTADVSPATLEQTVAACQQWFSACSGLAVERETTAEGCDLTIGGIEVGSYGIRRHGQHSWIYATGLAEPRFSTSVRMKRASQGSIG